MNTTLSSKALLIIISSFVFSGCASYLKHTDTSFTAFTEQLWRAEKQLNQAESGQLIDMSPEALLQRQQQRLAWYKRLQQIDVSVLTEQNQINHAILVYRLANEIDEYRFGAHLMPLTAESGFHTDLGFMPKYTVFRSVKDYQAYIQKLAAIPRYMQQQTNFWI